MLKVELYYISLFFVIVLPITFFVRGKQIRHISSFVHIYFAILFLQQGQPLINCINQFLTSENIMLVSDLNSDTVQVGMVVN